MKSIAEQVGIICRNFKVFSRKVPFSHFGGIISNSYDIVDFELFLWLEGPQDAIRDKILGSLK